MQQGTKKQTVFALEVEDKIIIGLKKKPRHYFWRVTWTFEGRLQNGNVMLKFVCEIDGAAGKKR